MRARAIAGVIKISGTDNAAYLIEAMWDIFSESLGTQTQRATLNLWPVSSV
ncbi:hypothetical protein VHP8226_01524 [Vibrio hippocampi]|uniref:Uncharacterized protein n=1 Tax=Vibrio hippocampi TaxID=654686 RepID=A0ABN8DHN6_9VIBR|nr:hypothetical protein VHP8226_01524 [Vibrio hippocampi]